MTLLIQKSFSGGEITDDLYARSDLSRYSISVKTLRNAFVTKHGTASNRSGIQKVCELFYASKQAKLVPFEFNTEQSYMLEFGDAYMRVVKNGELLTDSTKNISAITQNNPGTFTSVAHGFSNDDRVTVASVGGMVKLNERQFIVANVTADTFTLKYMNGTAVDTTAFPAYTSGGTVSRSYKIASPFLEADLPSVKYVQSADVVNFVNPSYAPRELRRTADTSWAMSSKTFTPAILAPTALTTTPHTAGTQEWVVTSIDANTFEESLASATVTHNAAPTVGSPVVIGWTAATGAGQYNVYRKKDGIFGLVGIAGGTSFSDVGTDPDTTDTPPTARNPFDAANLYPSTVMYYQQRLMYGNSNTYPERVWGSKSGLFNNFTVSAPIQDTDAITFDMSGRQVNSIKHLLDLGTLVIMTTGGEHKALGDQAGILRPGEYNTKQDSYNGSEDLLPVVIDSTALYLEKGGSAIKDIGYNSDVNGYDGEDLTIFSSHLFEGHTIVSWAFQKKPNSILWAVRDDGVLLGLTYIKKQQLLAWHRHDFEDTVIEEVATVREDNEDALYLITNRTVEGYARRYMERLSSRFFTDIQDLPILDSFKTFDGRNTDDSHTMTVSGGTTWGHGERLTLTSSVSYFNVSEDVGNQVILTGADGTIIRLEILDDIANSPTEVTVRPDATIPVAMRSALSTWSLAKKTFKGLWHLEGYMVSAFGDGLVVASPNNSEYVQYTVANGQVTFDEAYSYAHIGLPITSDLETLDFENLSGKGESLVDKKVNVTGVTLKVKNTRGVFAGYEPPTGTNLLEGLYEFKVRDAEGYNDPVEAKTAAIDVSINGQWTRSGKVFVRQVDPLPWTIGSIAASGIVGGRGV